MGGRPRTPTKVLEMRGAFVKHPERAKARANEPEPTGLLGKPPVSLDEDEAARWKDIAEWAPWLTNADRIIVEQTCRLWMLDRNGEASAAESKLLAVNVGKLGMNPSERSKVVQAPAKPDSKLDRFLRRQKA